MEKCIPVWFFNDSIQFKSRSEDFGRAGESAVSTELKQLHPRRVFESKHYHELSFKKQVHALKYRMFLKEKHTGQNKGRGCSYGGKQRLFMLKEGTTSIELFIYPCYN